MQKYSVEYFSKSYRRVFGTDDKTKRATKGGGNGVELPRWKSLLMYAAQGADGSLLPSELARVKGWRLTDFFDLVETKLLYADANAK